MTDQHKSTLPPPPPPPPTPGSVLTDDPGDRPGYQPPAAASQSASSSSSATAPSAAQSPASAPATGTPLPGTPLPGENRIVAFLGVDSVADAHRHANKIALDHANASSRTVAHLLADPTIRRISVSQNPDNPATAIYDLSGAVREVATRKGRLIQVAVGGLSRLELADIVEDVSGVTDRVLISGPGAALSQESLEFSTLADFATVVGGSEADANHVGFILDQLNIPNERVAAERAVRKISPPGRL